MTKNTSRARARKLSVIFCCFLIQVETCYLDGVSLLYYKETRVATDHVDSGLSFPSDVPIYIALDRFRDDQNIGASSDSSRSKDEF